MTQRRGKQQEKHWERKRHDINPNIMLYSISFIIIQPEDLPFRQNSILKKEEELKSESLQEKRKRDFSFFHFSCSDYLYRNSYRNSHKNSGLFLKV